MSRSIAILYKISNNIIILSNEIDINSQHFKPNNIHDIIIFKSIRSIIEQQTKLKHQNRTIKCSQI